MLKYIKVLVSIILPLLSRFSSGEEWNPMIDECDVKLIDFQCKPVVDGTIKPNDDLVNKDGEYILNVADVGGALLLLSKRNLLHRKEIRERFLKKDTGLYYRFYERENYVLYSDLLSGLLKSIQEFHVSYLIGAANMTIGNDPKEYVHGSTIFMAILGTLSNKGMRNLVEGIEIYGKSPGQRLLTLGERMELVGKYPTNFVNLVIELMKAERDEINAINDTVFADDLKNLKGNLKIEKGERTEENERFLVEILTKRSVLHLKALFSDKETEKFADQYAQIMSDDFFGNAIIELQSLVVNRSRGFAKILSTKRKSSFIFTAIVLCRGEIDLGNIKSEFDNSAHSLSDLVRNVYNDLPWFSETLLNLVNPPADIAWKEKSPCPLSEDPK